MKFHGRKIQVSNTSAHQPTKAIHLNAHPNIDSKPTLDSQMAGLAVIAIGLLALMSATAVFAQDGNNGPCTTQCVHLQ
jgi:hypothetical protein